MPIAFTFLPTFLSRWLTLLVIRRTTVWPFASCKENVLLADCFLPYSGEHHGAIIPEVKGRYNT